MQIPIIDLKESLLSDNDRDADKLRVELRAQKTFYLNVMSSPGSGKTSCILRTLEQLGKTFRCGVMEADIDSDVDADTVSRTGAKVSPQALRRCSCTRAACATSMRKCPGRGCAPSARRSWTPSFSKTSAILSARQSSTPVRVKTS